MLLLNEEGIEKLVDDEVDEDLDEPLLEAEVLLLEDVGAEALLAVLLIKMVVKVLLDELTPDADAEVDVVLLEKTIIAVLDELLLKPVLEEVVLAILDVVEVLGLLNVLDVLEEGLRVVLLVIVLAPVPNEVELGWGVVGRSRLDVVSGTVHY